MWAQRSRCERHALGTDSGLYDCVVIGGGVIGSSIAYHAAKAGARVALVEPGSPRFPSASWASAGGVRRQNRAPSEWALALAASRQWPAIEAELHADCEFRAGGHLHAALDELTFAAFARRAAEETAAGLDVQVVKKDGKEKLLYDRKKPWALLQLLEDQFVKSTTTDKKYAANSKREIVVKKRVA